MQWGRNQMILIFALLFLFLIVVVPLLNRKKGTGVNDDARAVRTLATVQLVDRAEQSYKAAHGRYTGNVADVVAAQPTIAEQLSLPISLDLEASSDGKTYVAQATSAVLTLVQVRQNGKLLPIQCVRLKRGIDCPAGSQTPTSTAGVTTQTSTTLTPTATTSTTG